MEQGEHNTTEHDALLCSYLAERDEECPMCSYNLRGLTGQVCPECGEALRMRVSLSDPKLGLYLAGLIGWAVGAGFSGIMLVFFTFVWLFDEYGPGLGESWPMLFQFAVQGSMLAWMLWKRRWIRTRSHKQRLRLAFYAWASTFGLSLAVFVALS